MNDLDTLIDKLISEKGGSPKDYHLLMDKIAYHETGGTLDPSQIQIGGGPGRGLFQFETGKHQGAITAAKRTKQYLKKNKLSIPKWLQRATQNDTLDANKLNGDQQKMLFLGNMRQHPKADLGRVIKGEEKIEDFWANYHWAGNEKDRYKRVNSFKNHMKEFKPVEEKKTSIVSQIGPLQEEQSFTPINNVYAHGGISGISNDKNLNHFNGGGTHEQNPLGGIPIGNNNSVESNETSFNIKGSKFIFSDRISLDGKFQKMSKSNNTYPDGGKLDPKHYLLNYIKSPKYKERLKSSGYNNIEEEINNRYNDLKNSNINIKDSQDTLLNQMNNSTDIPYIFGSYFDNNKNVTIDKAQVRNLKASFNEILTHELTHSSLKSKKNNNNLIIHNSKLNEYDNNQLMKRLSFMKESKRKADIITEKLRKEGKSESEIKDAIIESEEEFTRWHDLQPDENKSDINSLRYLLKKQNIYNAGEEDLTKEHLNKIDNGNFTKNRLLNNYSEEDLIWLMNNVASVDSNDKINIAAYGGKLDPPTKNPSIDVNKIKSQSFNWYLNPTTNKRLKSNLDFLGKDPSKSESMISKAASNISKVNVNQTNKNMGVIKGEFNKVDPMNLSLHQGATEQSLAHELGHATLGLDDTLTKFITKKYGSPLSNKRQQLIDNKQLSQNEDYSFSDLEGNKVPFAQQLKMMFPDKSSFSVENEYKYMKHINQNGELYPRFQEMRSFLNVNPGDIIDDSHIERLLNNKNTSELFKYYKPEVIKEILNNVADNSSTKNYNNIA